MRDRIHRQQGCQQFGWCLVLGILLFVLSGCGASAPTAAAPANQPVITPVATATMVSPQNSPPVTSPLSTPTSPGGNASTTSWNFDNDPVGQLPAGASMLAGEWAIRPEADAPSPPHALCQTGEAEFPSLLLGPQNYSDLVMTASFKVIGANELGNPTAGLIFRLRDKHHYYAIRANTSEGFGNFNIYRFWLGQRSLIKHTDWPLQKGQWYEMKVEAQGRRIRGYLNGTLVTEATDSLYTTGKVGLWVKNDSVACFDNVTVSVP